MQHCDTRHEVFLLGDDKGMQLVLFEEPMRQLFDEEMRVVGVTELFCQFSQMWSAHTYYVVALHLRQQSALELGIGDVLRGKE